MSRTNPVCRPEGEISVSETDLQFLADFIFVDDDKRYSSRLETAFESTRYDSEYDEDTESSTSEGISVSVKRSRTTASSINSAEKAQRRRERNRIGAKNTRSKKKLYHENLQRDIARLSEENGVLSSRVATLESLPSRSDEFSTTNSSALDGTGRLPVTTASAKHVNGSLNRSSRAYVLTDPFLEDNPIVFATQGFLTLTGYSLPEVLGKNCRLLQGAGSDPPTIDSLGRNVRQNKPCAARILNFRRSKQPFFNHICIAPLEDSCTGQVLLFAGTMAEEPSVKK